MDWEETLERAYKLIETEEGNKRLLWKLAYEIKKEYGGRGLKEFAGNLKDTFGVSRSHNTLRQYAYIYKMIQDYDIPEDLPYTIIRAIVSSKTPSQLIWRIKAEGLNSHDIMEIIKAEKPKKETLIECPKCHYEFTLKEAKKKKN